MRDRISTWSFDIRSRNWCTYTSCPPKLPPETSTDSPSLDRLRKLSCMLSSPSCFAATSGASPPVPSPSGFSSLANPNCGDESACPGLGVSLISSTLVFPGDGAYKKDKRGGRRYLQHRHTSTAQHSRVTAMWGYHRLVLGCISIEGKVVGPLSSRSTMRLRISYRFLILAIF